MGGRKMKVVPVALSLAATMIAPTYIMGVPAQVYSRGIVMIMASAGSLFAIIISAELFLPLYHRYEISSVNTYLYNRYQSRTLQMVASIVYTISLIPWIAIILYIQALILKSISGLSENWSILLSGVFVTFYTSIGGLKAVVWTDVVQSGLIYAGLLAIIIKGTLDVGGVSTVLQRSNDGGRMDFSSWSFNLYMPNDIWSLTIGSLILFASEFCAGQMSIQKACSLPTLAKAKM
ncbi:hypothetical protein B4U79_03887, partial [Dinothrombium tinctorium]